MSLALFLFAALNYQQHYDRLVERARNRVLSGYSERHHIVPRCLGGSEEPDNIVRLTPEEHYVAHQLLVKIYPGNRRLMWAVVAMTNGTKNQARNNKLYGWLRRRFAEQVSRANRGRRHSAEARAKMSAAQKGIKRGPRPEEHRRKISEGRKGIKFSDEHRAKLSAAKIGKTPKRGEQWRRNKAEANRQSAWKNRIATQLRYESPDERARTSASMKEVWAKRRAGALPMPKSCAPVEG